LILALVVWCADGDRTSVTGRGDAPCARIREATEMLLEATSVHDEALGEPASVWHYTRNGLQFVGVWTQKRRDLGEDAEPTFLHHSPSQHGLIGVYDGLGGAGTRALGHTADGRTLNNAFVASRLAHLTVQEWFTEVVREGESARDLRSRLAAVLDEARPRSRNKIGGTLLRDLPTTVALLEYQDVGKKRVKVTARWAGDSRCYVLDPGHGLMQVSRDDSAIDDALETLIADQPMHNIVSAGTDFKINEYSFTAMRPCVLICATDGFFNYVDTPALFEYQLLDSLGYTRPGDDAKRWGELLANWVRTCTADDASLAMVALGFPSFAEVRGSFEHRWKALRNSHFVTMAEGSKISREAFVEARAASWDEYREGYGQLLPPPSHDARDAAATRAPTADARSTETIGDGTR